MKTGFQELDTLKPAVTVVRLDFAAPRKEKGRWPLSFMLAVAVHCVVLFAGHYFIVQPAGYGLEGASASMEIYMVAALPQSLEAAPVALLPEAAPVIPEAESEMMVPKAPETPEKKAEQEAQPETAKDEVQKSDVQGDGSSPEEPGESETTFYSRASSETAGKEGKYRNSPPHYPALAERNGWEGTVVLKALIKEEGAAAEVKIEKGSGHRVLDEAALKAVKKWKFTPGTFGNTVVSSWIRIPVRFTLDD